MPDPLSASPPPRPRRPLFRKYLAFLFLLVAGSLSAHGIVEMYFGYWESREALMQLQEQKAVGAALQIEAFVQDVVQAMGLTTQSPEIQLEGITPRFRRSLYSLLRNYPAIMEATVIDRSGKQSLRHSRLRSNSAEDRQDYSTAPLFSTAVSGETYFSPVHFHLGSEPFLTVAVPITNVEGHRLGVLSAEVNLKYIRDVISEMRIGEAGFAYVVERGGDLIAHPDLALVLQKTNLNSIPQVQDFMNASLAPRPPPPPRSVLGRNAAGEEVLSSHTTIPQLGWGVFVEQPLREAFQPLYNSLIRTGVILSVVLLLGLLTAFTVTQTIVRPIEALKHGVSRIGHGHLTERIEVRTSDEIGDLATAFNAMASTLLASRQELEEYSRTLEQRVSERTRDLSTLLATARQAVSSLNLDEILPVVLRSAADLLHCHTGTIRLLDPETKTLRLAADHNLSEEFGLRGDIPLGQGRMGRVAQEGRPVVVEDVETDPFYHNKEKALQAGIRSIAIVPLQVREAIIGVLAVYDSEARRFSDEELSALTEFANLASLAIEKARLHEEATRQRREAEILAEIARDLSSSLELEALLRKIIGYARELCGSDMAFIAPYDPAEGVATIVAYVGTRTDVFKGVKILPGKGIGGKVLENREPFITEDYLHDPRWAHDYNPLAEQEGFVTNMAIPITRESELLGVLWVVNRSPRSFTTRDQAILTALATQAAIAIANARHYEETLKGKEYLGTILEINKKIGAATPTSDLLQTIADEAAHFLQADGVGFRLREGEFLVAAAMTGASRQIMQAPRLKIGESLSGQAAAEQHPIIVPDIAAAASWKKEHLEAALREGIQSAMFVPVRIGDRVIGVLSVHSRISRQFPQPDVDRATAFADQAAIAIENARLYAEAERRRRAAESLAAVGQLISQSLDPKEVGQQIVTSVTELLGALSAALFRLEPESGDLVAVAVGGDAALTFAQNAVLPRGTGASGLAVRERRPVVTANLLADPQITHTPELRARIEQARYRSIVSVPLIVKDRVIGALGVGGHPGRVFTTEEIRLAQTFADQAAIALEKAWLHQETIRQHQELAQRNRELQALYTLAKTATRSLDIASLTQAVLMTTIEVLHLDAGRLYVFDEKNRLLRLTAHHGLPPDVLREYESYAPGEGIVGRVFQQSRPLVFPDIASDPSYATMARRAQGTRLGFRSAAGLPILTQGRSVGVIYLFGRATKEFTPEDLALLSAIGGQIGIAIENARLYQSLEEYSRNLEERVRERTQELEIANQHKSEFLATMSHELRTPLNAIIGFSQLLEIQLGAELSDRHKRYLNHIHTSGYHLLNLINGILDLAKVESGKMDLRSEEVPLPELIQQVIGGVQPQAEAKTVSVSFQLQEGLDRVTLDAGKMKQILYNLLGNAVKFTPDGGRVHVAARVVQGSPQRDFLVTSVSDTGIGIKPEDLDRLFEPFQQIDSSLARKYPGTGLGLALTKKLVELHGGQIRVESTPGQGSTFTFTLALPAPVVLPVERAEIPAAIPEETGKGREGETQSDRPLILIVEDDPKAIDLLSTYLRDGGYRVAVARSGEEALAKTKALRPLAVTLDLLFPTEDGWQILQDLKADPDTRETPVAIVSILDDRPRGLQMGAVEYLVKPVTREALLAGLAHLGIPLPRVGGMQVLAIDDDPAVLELLRGTLEGQRVTLLTARDGPDGIRLAQTRKPDLILLDLMMPGMSGFEAVQHLRADPATAEIPVIICSAKLLTAPERELLTRQVEGILQKGTFRPRDLLQLIAEVRHRHGPTPRPG